MERNLLFVNKHPEIIQEFTKEMAEQNFKIDVADNGIDAALLLKKKEYLNGGFYYHRLYN